MDRRAGERRRNGWGLLAGCAGLAFVVVGASRVAPPDPELRLPREYRLAGLIERQQATAEQLRADLATVRARVETLSGQAAEREQVGVALQNRLTRAETQAGLVSLKGPGVRISLRDSDLERSPSGNVNDLVIHSEDVRVVLNGVWRAGAEAVAVNRQRVVGTTAVVCVGNTLLINGTVHSPPYVVEALGADADELDDDPAFTSLRRDATAFRLGFEISEIAEMSLPAYDGAVAFRHARSGGAG